MNKVVEVGTVVFVKTSEEPVFVLAIDNQTAVVRRPVQGDRGVTHVLDTFSLNELETREGKVEGEAAFQKFQLGVRDKFARERQAEAKEPQKAVSDAAVTEEYLN